MCDYNDIGLEEGPFFWKQVIRAKGRKINIFIGIGLMNSKGKISIDLPFDILIIIGALLELQKKYDLKIIFILADQNAILQLDPNQDQNKISKINKITDEYYQKLEKILKSFHLFDYSKIIKVSSLSNDDNYNKIVLPMNNNTPYENEQLKTMKYYKSIGYNYRLSWKGDKKRKSTNRDEEYFDNLYRQCLNEEPMQSIYIKSGKKSLKHGLGTAIPYSYYEDEIGSRLPFNVVGSLTYENDKIKNHTENLLKYFVRDKEIDQETFNQFIRKCLNIHINN